MRGLCIATGQYSSFYVSAVVCVLGVLDNTGVEVQDREQVEMRGNAEARETEEEDKTMNMFCADTSCDTLSHNVMCAQG